MEMILTDRFKKSFSKYVKKHPSHKNKIYQSLEMLKKDISNPLLFSHKLSGQMKVMYACKCGFDCRIIFSLEETEKIKKKVIILIDIGSHSEVY